MSVFVKPFPNLKFRFLWLAIGYALVLFVIYMSLTSHPIDTGHYFPYEDKFYHALAYFSLMAWFAQIYHDRFQRNMIALVFILMGATLEYLQSYDPNRMFEYADMAANFSGVMLGMLLAFTAGKNVLLRLEGLIIKS